MTTAVPAVPYGGARFDLRAPRPHVESYFLKANDPVGRRAIWLKTTIFAGRRDPSAALAEAWAVAFDPERGHVAVKTQVPLARARFDRQALDVEVDGCTMTPGSSHGRVASGGRSITWDLRLQSRGLPLVHLPHPSLYEGPLPSTKLVSPVFDALADGFVEVRGERWDVASWPALLGHNWGRSHAPLYAWGHCNAWDGGEPLVFEGVSARVAAGPVLLPTTTLLAVHHRGVRYELNAPAEIARARGTIEPRRWTFRAAGEHARIEGEMWGEADDFVGLFYPNPDGAMTYCLNSKIAHARLFVELRGRAPMELTSSRAALEVGTRDPHHGVRMYV